jgi:hypothetical protein
MDILFPCSPESRSAVDPTFSTEREAAEAAGFAVGLYSHESIESREPGRILCAACSGRQYLLRGWMMTGEQYELLFRAVSDSRSTMITDPVAYSEAHYLPLGYQHIVGETPKSAWILGDDISAAWQLYQDFRDHDAIIKDWVKSAKHRWREACFIPVGSEESAFGQIYRAFREARGHLFNRGVVLRRYVPLATRGTDLRGFPLVDEYRLFYLDRRLFAMPRVEGYDAVLEEVDRWDSIAARFVSRFVSIDVARLDSGEWIVVEVGDGGVSGLPLSIDPKEFYGALTKPT